MNRGRAAFKEAYDDEDNESSMRAMRSFTQSIECDLPPAPSLPASLDIDQLGYSDDNLSMKRENTNDTIIEVLKEAESSCPDQTMGETQKYKMTVPGPGHVEQETELHRSLLREEMSLDVDQVSPEELTFPKPARPTNVADPDSFSAALRDHHAKTATLQSRPRPTTPTQSCALETFAFVLPEDEVRRQEEERRSREQQRIRVTIPARRPRTASQSYSDFVDNMAAQIPPQMRSAIDYRSDNEEEDVDILEKQPAYKKKASGAPAAPVKHRRSSVEWENFEEMRDQAQSFTSPQPPDSCTAFFPDQDMDANDAFSPTRRVKSADKDQSGSRASDRQDSERQQSTEHRIIDRVASQDASQKPASTHHRFTASHRVASQEQRRSSKTDSVGQPSVDRVASQDAQSPFQQADSLEQRSFDRVGSQEQRRSSSKAEPVQQPSINRVASEEQRRSSSHADSTEQPTFDRLAIQERRLLSEEGPEAPYPSPQQPEKEGFVDASEKKRHSMDDDDDAPQFSEEMQEQRAKIMEARRRAHRESQSREEVEEEKKTSSEEEENPMFPKMPLHQKKSIAKQASIAQKRQASISKQMSLGQRQDSARGSMKSIPKQQSMARQGSTTSQGPTHPPPGHQGPPSRQGSIVSGNGKLPSMGSRQASLAKAPSLGSRQGSVTGPPAASASKTSISSQKRGSLGGREPSVTSQGAGEHRESLKAGEQEPIQEELGTQEAYDASAYDTYNYENYQLPEGVYYHEGQYYNADGSLYQYDAGAQQEEGAYEYDPNAYPGYTWNYETQQWEATGETEPTATDATATAAAEVEAAQADPNAQYDYSVYQQPEGAATDYSAYYQGYDQSGYDASAYADAYSSAAAAAAAAAGQQQPDQQYDYSQYPGYDQAAYDAYYGQQYNAGYDQPVDANYQYDAIAAAAAAAAAAEAAGGAAGTAAADAATAAYYQGYDQQQQQQAYDYSQYYAQQGYAQQGYTTEQQAYSADQHAYSTEQQAYPDASLSVNTAYDPYQGAYEGYGGQPVGSVSPYPASDPSPYPEPSPSGYQAPASEDREWDTTGFEVPSAAPVAVPIETPVTIQTTACEELDRTREAGESKAAPPPRPPPASPARPAPPARPAAPTVSPKASASTAATTNGPPPVPAPPSARPPPPVPRPPVVQKKKEEEPEEDAWTRFNRMTAKVSEVVKKTEETLKDLGENTAVNDIKDESYLATVGGEQGYFNSDVHRSIMAKQEEKAKEKAIKKKMKARGKKTPSPELDPNHEADMDRKAMELAAKLAQNRPEFEDWRPDIKAVAAIKKESGAAIPPKKRSSLQDSQRDSGSMDLPGAGDGVSIDGVQPIGDLPTDDPSLNKPSWSNNFDAMELPASDSGFFLKGESEAADPFVVTTIKADPFAPKSNELIDENFDPFAVKPVEEIVAAAKAKAEVIAASRAQNDDDDDVYEQDRRSEISTPTEPGSPVNGERPSAFDDEFKVDPSHLSTPTPLYDEDDSQPLAPFCEDFTGDGWELMLRHPLKKKMMAERQWKPCYVRIVGNMMQIYNNKSEQRPMQETLLQSSCSLSDTSLQAYDIYGKLHTVKLQHIQYKERVGIRQGQIARLMEGHVTKYGMPLEHAAQCTVLAKFGSTSADVMQSFISVVEDILFQAPAKRDKAPVHKQDEVQVHCYDEYACYVDKDGIVSEQKARVRMFCLAFVTGKPFLEIGLNDRRRQGKEIVRRKDILPMYTERWIRFENLEFHSIVDLKAFEEEQVIKIPPPDGCFFELMRFRVRPPQNREKNLTVKAMMKIAGSKVEIRIEAMAAANASRSRGTADSRRTIPCEDICIRFPIPEAWIYIFREERHWGVGSVHAKKMKPGKVKNLKERLLGAVQTVENNLIQVGTGEAKYEHVYRSLVWRIPRLPKEQQEAYKSYMLKCRFELSSFDLMPDEFLPNAEVDFTMPLATISNTVVRSISVEQHEDPDRVEKFVRYVAKSHYKLEIDYVQCMDLDAETSLASKPNMEEFTMPEMHQPAMNPGEIGAIHDNYRISLPEEARYERREKDSSSDEEEEKDTRKMPMVKIDMSNYGY